MAVTTVEEIIRRVKLVLQEVTESGTRWTNDELIGWLNESYQSIIGLRPDAASISAPLNLVAGTKQTIPDAGLRLLDVVRNLGGDQRSIMVCDRRQLDATRRNWHSEPAVSSIEHFIFDEMTPRHFYVYPPAEAGTQVEIVYSHVPTPHNAAYATAAPDQIKVDDSYAPAMVDYILYRAYSKDADFSANANRAAMHYNTFNTQLGGKGKMDMGTSPNAGKQG